MCKLNLNVVSIDTSDDITTLTVSDNALQPILPLCNCPQVNFCINTSFAIERLCTRIVVTDGTSTLPLAKCNQYYRPERLRCNSVIQTIYRNDPHLFVVKGVG